MSMTYYKFLRLELPSRYAKPISIVFSTVLFSILFCIWKLEDATNLPTFQRILYGENGFTNSSDSMNILNETSGNYTEDALPEKLKGRMILVGQLEAMSTGGQLGNQVYELLTFLSIARNLKRVPVLIFGDVFNDKAQPQFWNLAATFPKILEEVEIYDYPAYYNYTWTQIKIGPCPSCYYPYKKMAAPYKDELVLSVYGRYMQNARYLEELGGRAEVNRLLGFSQYATQLIKSNVDQNFYTQQNRKNHSFILCVHTRRTDFVTNQHQFTSWESTIEGILKIINGNEETFGVLLFGDDRSFLEDLRSAKELEPWRQNFYLERRWPGKFAFPAHFTWLFMKEYCTHIYLTASTSTFGFFGAYLAGGRATVYYRKGRQLAESIPYRLPDEWIRITKN